MVGLIHSFIFFAVVIMIDGVLGRPMTGHELFKRQEPEWFIHHPHHRPHPHPQPHPPPHSSLSPPPFSESISFSLPVSSGTVTDVLPTFSSQLSIPGPDPTFSFSFPFSVPIPSGTDLPTVSFPVPSGSGVPISEGCSFPIPSGTETFIPESSALATESESESLTFAYPEPSISVTLSEAPASSGTESVKISETESQTEPCATPSVSYASY